MIYEIRTYNIRATMVPEYQKRFAEKLQGRLEFSPLGAHLYTEIGPINQVVAIWPYESLEERRRIRAEAEAAGVWPLTPARWSCRWCRTYTVPRPSCAR